MMYLYLTVDIFNAAFMVK